MQERTVSVLRTHDDREVPVAGVYEIDGAHTSVEFVGRHLMITKIRGRFSDVQGRITIAENPEDSHVEVEIGAESVSTGNSDRDNHLRSADFFDVDQFPSITFRSTLVRALPNATWEVLGDLTVHGFRSCLRDWAAELTSYPGELSEAALAHVVRDKVEAAYRRGDLFDKRRDMMAAWAAFCARPYARPMGNLVTLRAG